MDREPGDDLERSIRLEPDITEGERETVDRPTRADGGSCTPFEVDAAMTR
jgi:hypothetical protein